jgi:endonuclease YncB( thermonuclease family)
MTDPTVPAPAYRFRAYAERVHDGDTYQLRIDLGFDVAVSIMCRLRGVDTPELGTEDGKKARDYVMKLLRPSNVRWDDVPIESKPRELVVESYKDRRSFARWVCDVWMLNGAGQYVSLADALLVAGMAKPLILP